VQFAGFREDLDTYLGCFDLFAHPALKEGLGVATLKAAAAGLPVVGFAAGGLVEAVTDGKTGLLVDAEDTVALAAAIERLAREPELARDFGAAGRQRMQTEFSIATMADQHITLYESALNG
jgi:glycosyltransferase involved in cell wall biosynthesis